MPHVMANRRRRQPALPDRSRIRPANSVDQLAFTYMEMCKVESSTDSDSEISPRWSDTSTLGGVSSAPESGLYRRTLPLPIKPAGRASCCSVFLDPYDGSSEDSDESNVPSRQSRQAKAGGGGCRFSGRTRRFSLHHPPSFREAVKIGTIDPLAEQKHLLEVQMKCDSGSDLWVCELDVLSSSSRDGERPPKKTSTESMAHDQAMDIDLDRQFDHSGLHNPRAFAAESQVERNMFHVLDSACERAPSCCNPRSLYKRKLELFGVEMAALEKRKKQCMVGMEEEEQEQEGGSAADPRWSHLTTE